MESKDNWKITQFYKEIDHLSDEELEKTYDFIHEMKSRKEKIDFDSIINASRWTLLGEDIFRNDPELFSDFVTAFVENFFKYNPSFFEGLCDERGLTTENIIQKLIISADDDTLRKFAADLKKRGDIII